VLRVGLTGGLATGKSFVGDILASLGCYVIRADELGHQVLQPGGPAYEPVIREFGTGILKEDGSIDRQKLAAEVFGKPGRLGRLNELVHPHVIELEEQLLEDFARRQPNGIGVVEAAILIETGSYKRFDKLIVTYCRPEQQWQRALERGWSPEQVEARLRHQIPLEEKLRLADFIIDTSGTKEDTIRQVREVYEQLRRFAA